MTGVSFIVFESLLHMYLVVEKDGTKMDQRDREQRRDAFGDDELAPLNAYD